MDPGEVDPLQNVASEALEAAGEVAHPHAEHHSSVERAAPRDDSAQASPVRGAAAGDVAGAEREVRAAGARVDQARHVGRVVREVAVHLEHVLGVARQQLAETREVGRTEALLVFPVEDRDPVALGGESVGEFAGAVGRVVVDHEHADSQWLERVEHPREVLPLVVRR